MALGPGKYDEQVTRVRTETDADAVILVVVGGKLGSGMSVQAGGAIGVLPSILRQVADNIEADLG